MPDGRTVKEPPPGMSVYVYDGSFEGLLCCVFESYSANEMPADILPESEPLPLLLAIKQIATDPGRAARVKKSIPQKIGRRAFDVIRRAFLTCHPKRDILILRFLRLGFRFGPAVMNRLTDETVNTLFKAVNFLERESHLYKEFIRFSEVKGVLTAKIEPKNMVLPLIARHFCERFPEESFLIYDKTHSMVLLYRNHAVNICGVESFEQPAPDDEELKFRELWRLFYKTIEIKERHNPRCRMSHMPKRYWNCMTEFARGEVNGLALPAKTGQNG